MALVHAQAPLRCTILIDAATGKALVREGQCDQRVTPASTFKIAISLMGYDSGILQDEHTPALPFKDGYIDWLPEWRATTDPAAWMKKSVIWYSYQVTSRLGQARFERYVNNLNYGNRDWSGLPRREDGLVLPWLSSSLKISPAEQAVFLTKLVNRKLPISAKAVDMTSRLMQFPPLNNGWKVFAKTGTGNPHVAMDKGPGGDYGWFVGWARKGQRTIVFVRLVQDENDEDIRAGLRVRDAMLAELPGMLDAL